MMHKGRALTIGTFRNAGEAARRPPLSSNIGNSDIIKHTAPELIFPANIAVNNKTNFSDISRFYFLRYKAGKAFKAG